MTTTHAQPSGDPADDDSLAGTLRQVMRKQLQQTDNMLPAVVVSFDRVKNRAQVKPCVTLLTTDGRAIPRAAIASVPVVQMGGRGVVLNFDLQAGDLGWIHASDRDISQFLQSYKVSPPNTVRIHSFQDAVFYPDVMKGWTIDPDDAGCAVLQSLDGQTRISITAGRIKLTRGAKSVTLDGNGVTIVGGLTVDGIVFGTHKHTGIQPGGGTSGGPTA